MDYFYFLPFGFSTLNILLLQKRKLKRTFSIHLLKNKYKHSEGKTLGALTYTSEHTLQKN